MKMILGANESVPTGDPTMKGAYEPLKKVGESMIDSSLASSLASSLSPTKMQEKASDANQASAKSKNGAKRSGRWTLDEKILFLYGLRRFGKGRWKKISIYLPDRSLVQIKSHAQKVLKRLDSGENVFRRLHENVNRTDALVSEIHSRYGIDPPDWWTKRKSQDAVDVAEQFDAASALCQLSSVAQPTSSDPHQVSQVSAPAVLSP